MNTPVNFGLLFSRTFSALPHSPAGIGLLFVSMLLIFGSPVLSEASPILMVLMLPGMVGSFLGMAVVNGEVLGRLENRSLSAGEAFSAGLSRSGAFFLVMLVTGLLIGLASILLVIPGLMLMTRWWVAGAASVTEGLAVGAAMKRSSELTAGRRMSIFGLYFVMSLIVQVSQFAMGAIGAASGSRFALVLLICASSAFGIALFATSTAVTLKALRDEREGERSQVVASVFA
jgi:hypothetical protein